MKGPSKKRWGVPFIRQTEMTDCGAACLAMMLGAHGKTIPLEEIKQRMEIRANGTDALSMLEAAAFYGLPGRGVETDIATLRKLPLPLILHWARLHFVVLVGWSKGRAEIFDPGIGCLELSLSEFQQHFSGTALLFERSEKPYR